MLHSGASLSTLCSVKKGDTILMVICLTNLKRVATSFAAW